MVESLPCLSTSVDVEGLASGVGSHDWIEQDEENTCWDNIRGVYDRQLICSNVL